MRKVVLFAALVALSVASAGGFYSWAQKASKEEAGEYNPVIDPANFVAEVTNKYFALKPGKKFEYKNTAGTERIEIAVTNEKKKIMGVTTTVIRAREWKNGVLTEDTYDWYAQDKEGNVWYFGEAVNNYANGKIRDHSGSWQAGMDGAKPGIIMLANPKVGDTYRQEYYKGKAEDMGTIMSVDKQVTTRYGTFDNCVQIRDWSRISSDNEYKYYCPAAGFLVMEQSAVPGGGKVELVAITEPSGQKRAGKN